MMPDSREAIPRRTVLNVGGASKAIPIPDRYAGWEHLLLDIDRRRRPDIVCDVIYGFGKEIESSGKDFYAHKTGFGPNSLRQALVQAGFPYVMTTRNGFELAALAFKSQPDPARLEELGVRLLPSA
jgi:hypothetical protein